MVVGKRLEILGTYSQFQLDQLVRKVGGGQVASYRDKIATVNIYHASDTTLRARIVKGVTGPAVRNIDAYADNIQQIRSIESEINSDIYQMFRSIP